MTATRDPAFLGPGARAPRRSCPGNTGHRARAVLSRTFLICSRSVCGSASRGIRLPRFPNCPPPDARERSRDAIRSRRTKDKFDETQRHEENSEARTGD